MEKLHFHDVICQLFVLNLLSFPFVSSSAYTPECKFFYNCGSEANFSPDDRTFLRDQNSQGKTLRDESASPNTSLLYQTARFDKHGFSYEFNITHYGAYFVRLHFFAFSSGGTNLAGASFNVLTSDFSLLSNFSDQSSSDGPVIKEYLLTLSSDKFTIYFVPEEASFAFVNAIEVFSLPDNFTNDKASAIPPVKNTDGRNYSGLLSDAFLTIHRINVGGDEVNDSLWRNWKADDNEYLVSVGLATDCSRSSRQLTEGPDAVDEIAPDLVYKTCKEVKGTSNITWSFNVKNKDSKHFVRVHFCDIVSSSVIDLDFVLYINGELGKFIDPYEYWGITNMATPFVADLVAQPDNAGNISISVGPRQNSTQKIAILNGVEIMEFVDKKKYAGFPSHKGNSSKLLFVIIGSVGSAAFVSIAVLLFFLGVKRRKSKQLQALIPKDDVPYAKGKSPSWIVARIDNASALPNLNLKLKMPLAEVLAATQAFDTKLLIGEGGFGKVYKGTLWDGMTVAVKRSDSSHGQGLPEFQTEVLVLSKIRHRHLVSLIGYCDEGSEMILVYEFMEKGTLRDHLYCRKENSKGPSSAEPVLTWKQRLEICIGSAKGLHYLHTGSDGGIIHRDVKSTNILLDEHYVAKVADFGLSRSGPPDSDDFFMGVKGSFGYLDPEYFKTLQLTAKSDVFSLGVVLLEVLCARPPIVSSSKREEINLAEWGLFWQNKGQLEKIVDPSLVGQINPNSLRKFGQIVEKCLKPEEADRPTMLDVCWDLEYALQLQQTVVHREPHEDSSTDASSNMVLSIGQGLSTTSFPNGDDGMFDAGDDSSSFFASGVFSQLRIDGSR